MAKRQAGKVQGTDADLRRMTTAQAKERLRCAAPRWQLVGPAPPGVLLQGLLGFRAPCICSHPPFVRRACTGRLSPHRCLSWTSCRVLQHMHALPCCCRNYGLTEDEITGLGRWTMIDMVRGRPPGTTV